MMVHWCCKPGPHWLPFFVAVGTPLTFIITYVISVFNGHVEAGFPYISDTGTNSPESCIFGQLMNINALLVGIVVYIRYKQIVAYYRNEAIVQLYIIKLNKASLIIGIVAGFGLSIVANFQETNVLAVHLIGAFTGFACGCIYAWIHAVISYKMQAFVTHRGVCHLRTFLAVVMTLFFIITFTFDPLSKYRFHGKNPRKWNPNDGFLTASVFGILSSPHRPHKGSKWSYDSPGFKFHVISTSSEWIMSFSMMAYFLTFIREFHHTNITPIQLSIYIPRGPLRDSVTSADYVANVM